MQLTEFRDRQQYVACLAVQQACFVGRFVQKKLDSSGFILKEDQSPVTVADYAVQATVNLIFLEHFGNFLMTGEESSEVLLDSSHESLLQMVIEAVKMVLPNANKKTVLEAIDCGNHNATGKSFWTLDPIDGTKGFLRGEQYAIALALIQNGQPVFGVLGCPNLNSDASVGDGDVIGSDGAILFASLGEGAFVLNSDLNTDDIAASSINISNTPVSKARYCASVEKAHSNRSSQDDLIEKISSNPEKVYVDSQCKYALVASGHADAYLRLPTSSDYRERIWDHAAGALIAQESGACVTDVHGKQLDFSQGVLLKENRGVICAIPSVHSAVISSLANTFSKGVS